MTQRLPMLLSIVAVLLTNACAEEGTPYAARRDNETASPPAVSNEKAPGATAASSDNPASPKADPAAPVAPTAPTAPIAPAAPTCANDADSVKAGYEMALLRTPDTEGLQYWLVRLQGGLSRFEALKAMVGSAEFAKVRAPLSDIEFVSGLFVGFLGRPSDADGLAFWVGQLASGVSRNEVALNIVGSDEFADPAARRHTCFF